MVPDLQLLLNNTYMGEWVREWASEWVSEWVSERASEQASEWVSEWVNEWMSEWVNEWMSEWVSDIRGFKSSPTLDGSRLSFRLSSFDHFILQKCAIKRQHSPPEFKWSQNYEMPRCGRDCAFSGLYQYLRLTTTKWRPPEPRLAPSIGGSRCLMAGDSLIKDITQQGLLCYVTSGVLFVKYWAQSGQRSRGVVYA